ncbi:uncharacterized protein AMSG_08035 [Thecamonas trahens ATCC 50062]|uniref:Kinesin motor domain-containing protein n=1 Tax=Thecamonas trahens ATCC 50062 TaxID=461836 RepID=A0A0L0DM62_THETB|nr:hypothetical protein AMSG_08035 [Thecamonas trahens ATCC 50062]KNC52478.1 hypothetical protein AMSG_08035 [Thecamonas trahens ATCC 50062]|eukprot:XP_013755278.1 hypothetical protein AMSG_08035 [Thecamonas trahens ATCC 50062]
MSSTHRGVPLNVVARIQPTPPGELNTTFGVLINNNKVTLEHDSRPSSQHTLDYVYGPDATTRDVFERSLYPTVANFVEGVNVAILALGASGSGRSHTLAGPRDGSEKGAVALVIDAAFDLLREKERKVNKGSKKSASARPYRYRVRGRYLEVYNEEVNDLLDPGNASLEIALSEERGWHVSGLSGRWVDGPDDLADLYDEGRASRVNMETDVGPAALRATGIFTIELTQSLVLDGEAVELLSTFHVVELPAAEKLSEDPAALRVREGPTLNRALLSFARLATSLADEGTRDFANYSESKATQLMYDVLGGNCLTLVIATLATTDYTRAATTLSWADTLSSVENYPVVNDARVRTLLRRARLEYLRARDGVSGGGGAPGAMPSSGGDGDSGSVTEKHLMKIHQLEGRIIKDNLEKIKLREDKDKILTKLTELKGQYEKLVESKASIQAELISSEEERLRVAKALIDLQIENNSLEEDGETKNFELVNKVLSLENDLMEAEMRHQTQEQLIADMRDALESAGDEARELQVEYVALKTNFMNAKAAHAAETAKNQELGLELLNLVNAKRSLESDKTSLEKRVAELLNMQGDADAMLQAQKDERNRIEAEVRDLREQSAVLKAELLKQQVALEQEVLDLESQKVGVQRKMVEVEKSKADDVASLKRQFEASKKKHAADVARLEEQNHLLNRDLNRANRAARDAEEQLARAKHETKKVEYELNAKEAELAKAQDKYRNKLRAYMSEISSLSRTMGKADDLAAAKTSHRSHKSRSHKSRHDRKSRHRRSRSRDSDSDSGDDVNSDRAAALANANLHAQQNLDALVRELTESYAEKEAELRAAVDRLRSRNRELVARQSLVLSAYAKLRGQLEDEGVKAVAAPSITELEDSVGATDLKTEVERDLEIALAAAEAKAANAEDALARQAESNLSALEKHQQTVLELQARNAAVANELEALRIFKSTVEASGGSGLALEDVHDALRSQIESLQTTVTASEKEELVALRREVEELRSAARLASARATEHMTVIQQSTGGDFEELRRALKDFILKTQSRLETERSRLLARATMAEEQLSQLQLHMSRQRSVHVTQAHVTPQPRHHVPTRDWT